MADRRGDVLAQRRRELEEKRAKLARLKQLQTSKVVAPATLDPKAQGSATDSLLREVNKVFSSIGEKPVSVVLRDRPVTQGSSAAQSSSALGDSSARRVVHNIGVVDISPNIIYDKEIQTSKSFLGDVAEAASSSATTGEVGEGGGASSSSAGPDGPGPSDGSGGTGAGDGGDDVDDEEGEGEVVTVERLDQHEVFGRKNFQNFFSRSSLLVERVLGAQYDPLHIFSPDDAAPGETSTSEKLILENEFVCDFSRDRVVTALSYCESKSLGHLFLSAHFTKPGAENVGGGVVVWSQLLPGRPERVFHSENPVSCAVFSRYDPAVIFGGTYMGEILAWDMRMPESTPAQRSPINFESHRHPIFGLSVSGTQVSHTLLSLSNEGILCEWTKCQLDQEPRTIPMKVHYGDKQQLAVPTTCLGLRRGTFDKVFVGSENGHLYSAFLYGDKEGIDQQYDDAHYGTVTTIDFHPFAQEFGDYALTSSVDWSCALWNQKRRQPVTRFTGDVENYIYDVRWSPVHPAVFATADGGGCLKIWNLNRDTDAPVHSIVVGDEQSRKKALNKLCWSADGRHIVVGATSGRCYQFRVAEDEWVTAGAHEVQAFRSAIVKMQLANS